MRPKLTSLDPQKGGKGAGARAFMAKHSVMRLSGAERNHTRITSDHGRAAPGYEEIGNVAKKKRK